MFLPPFINCLIGKHDPNRRAVQWNGQEYVGYCRHCEKPIRRISHRSWSLREVEAEAQ